MPKNQKGGKNFKKGKKGAGAEVQRHLLYKDDSGIQDYALVKKKLGDCRFTCVAQKNSIDILCHVRGKMKKRIWINEGDIVLITLREYEDGKADIIHKYSPEDANVLRKNGDLTIKDDVDRRSPQDDDNESENDDVFEFDEDADEIDLDEL